MVHRNISWCAGGFLWVFGLQIFADDARIKLVPCCQSEKESLGAYAVDLSLYAWHGDDIKKEELLL